MLRSTLLRSITAMGMVAAAAHAAAQTPPTIPTPSELGERRPETLTDPSRLPQVLPPPRQLGKPEDDARFDITGYELSPQAPEALRLALASLTAPYTGKDKSFADMADAAREITRFLQRDLGYYLGFAYVPEQQPGNGVIRIEVLEGRLDAVELVWKEGLSVDRPVIEAYLAQLQAGSVLLVGDVERVVFLVNDLRGIEAEFEVRPGRTPGTATLVVTPRATPLLTGSLEGDNANSRFLGRARLGATVVRNSPFGRGDSLTANLVASKGLIFALGSYTTPVGADGLRLGGSISALRYRIDKDAFPQGLEGTAGTLSAIGLYPTLRSRNLNLFVVGTLDLKSYRDFDGATTNPKRVVALSLGVTGDQRDNLGDGGINSIDAQLTSGHIHFEIPPVVDAPDADFNKLTLRLVRLQNLVPGVLQGYGALRLQKSFDNLDVTEQFRAGGPDGVRAFPQGEGSGDNGALVTLELRAILPATMLTSLGGHAFVSLFADWARVQQRNNASGQDASFVNTQSYGGWGIAAVWNGPDGWDLRASLAKPTTGTVRNDADRVGARLYLQVSKQF